MLQEFLVIFLLLPWMHSWILGGLCLPTREHEPVSSLQTLSPDAVPGKLSTHANGCKNVTTVGIKWKVATET